MEGLYNEVRMKDLERHLDALEMQGSPESLAKVERICYDTLYSGRLELFLTKVQPSMRQVVLDDFTYDLGVEPVSFKDWVSEFMTRKTSFKSHGIYHEAVQMAVMTYDSNFKEDFLRDICLLMEIPQLTLKEWLLGIQNLTTENVPKEETEDFSVKTQKLRVRKKIDPLLWKRKKLRKLFKRELIRKIVEAKTLNLEFQRKHHSPINEQAADGENPPTEENTPQPAKCSKSTIISTDIMNTEITRFSRKNINYFSTSIMNWKINYFSTNIMNSPLIYFSTNLIRKTEFSKLINFLKLINKFQRFIPEQKFKIEQIFYLIKLKKTLGMDTKSRNGICMNTSKENTSREDDQRSYYKSFDSTNKIPPLYKETRLNGESYINLLNNKINKMENNKISPVTTTNGKIYHKQECKTLLNPIRNQPPRIITNIEDLLGMKPCKNCRPILKPETHNLELKITFTRDDLEKILNQMTANNLKEKEFTFNL